jgi:hypothetical protein
MLEASITFSGAGQLCMYTGNCEAIQAPTISQTNTGQYMVQFLTGRHIDRTKIPCACITVTCQNPSGIAVIPIVFPSPTSTYNANATGGYFYTITFGVQTLSRTGAFVNPIEVMVNIVCKNNIIVTDEMLEKLKKLGLKPNVKGLTTLAKTEAVERLEKFGQKANINMTLSDLAKAEAALRKDEPEVASSTIIPSYNRPRSTLQRPENIREAMFRDARFTRGY